MLYYTFPNTNHTNLLHFASANMKFSLALFSTAVGGAVAAAVKQPPVAPTDIVSDITTMDHGNTLPDIILPHQKEMIELMRPLFSGDCIEVQHVTVMDHVCINS